MHTPVFVPAKPGNCKKRKTIAHWYCDHCKTNYADEACTIVLESIKGNYGPHSYESETTKEPTCTEPGEAIETCRICGDSYTTTIKALGHSFDPETHICVRCGEFDPAALFTVKFDTDGGTEIEKQGVKPNEKATRPYDPEKDGHTFEGWFVGEEEYDFDKPVTGNLTITAHWKANIYTVKFDSKGGSEIAAQTVEYGKTVTAPTAPEKAHSTFLGWQLNGTAYDFTSPVKSDITLTALWKPDEYTVTFMLNGKIHSTAKVEYGEKVKFPTIEPAEGNIIVGWCTNEAMSEKFVENTAVTADITLYATEVKKEATIVNGQPVSGTVADSIGGLKGETAVITITEDEDVTKITFPKADETKSITIDGGYNELKFNGGASIHPNQELTLTDITIRAEHGGKKKTITLTAAAGGMTLENVTLDGKNATINAKLGDLTLGNITAEHLTVKGAAATTLTVDGTVSAEKISGFGNVIVEGTLTVTKSLKTDNLYLADGGVLVIEKEVSVTIGKSTSGSGTIRLVKGFKNIELKGTASGNIKLVSDKPMTDGQLLFKSKITNLNDVFDVTGIAPEVTDGEYSYGLYLKSGKVYLRAFMYAAGDKTYCDWSDFISSINKAKTATASYSVKLLGDVDLGKAITLPAKGKYAGLTIDGGNYTITFNSKTLKLTGNLTLKNMTVRSKKGEWSVTPGNYIFETENADLIGRK